MELVFLGTGSAYPSPYRGASSIALRNKDGSVWLFDCAEGTQTQLMKSNVKPGRITKIFITHLHGDHVFGLPGLLATMSLNAIEMLEPLDIYGPQGLTKYLRTSLSLSGSHLGFSYVVSEMVPTRKQFTEDWQKLLNYQSLDPRLTNEKPGRFIMEKDGVWQLYSGSKLSVQASWLRHRIPSFGFVVDESDIPGRLNAQILKDKGVPPGPLYAKIKRGESITLGDGDIINPCDVLGPARKGRKVVILGDTSDSSAMTNISLGATVLVHEATLEDDKMSEAIEKGHSTPGMAGEFARSIGAKKLVLTHFSQRYKPQSQILLGGDSTCDSDIERMIQQAIEAFKSDSVVAAEDFTSVTIPLADD